MGHRVRWRPLGAGALVGVRLRSYMPILLALLVLTIAASASASVEAESNPTNVPSAPKIASRLVQAAWNAVNTVKSSAGSGFKDRHSRAIAGQWEISDVAWVGALICAVQGLILWKMTAAATKPETQSKAGGNANDRPSSLWAAWKVNPEHGELSYL